METIVLVGGSHDGEVISVPELPPVFYVAVMTGDLVVEWRSFDDPPALPACLSFARLRYEPLRFGMSEVKEYGAPCMIWVSRDDAGHARYQLRPEG